VHAVFQSEEIDCLKQWANINPLLPIGKISNTVDALVYSEQCPDVFEWHHRFKDGHIPLGYSPSS
jgi:hypothetical protein